VNLLTCLAKFSIITAFVLLIMLPVSGSRGFAQDENNNAAMKVALLPILDSLPFYVALENGYFKEAGLRVEAVRVNSGLDRDQLMQAGVIDGMLCEIHSAASFNRDGIKVKIVRVARRAYQDFPLFRILAAPGSTVNSPGDIAGQVIGVSKNTIIEYVTDRLLTAEGLSSDDIVKQSIPAIPERFQLLLQGRIKAATLPDPLAKSAMESGAVLVIDDSRHPFYSVSVLSFSCETLTEKPDSVRAFLACWDKAAAAINDEPETYRTLLLEKVRMPKNVSKTYTIPPYPGNEVPEKAQWNDVMDWMIKKSLLKHPLVYEDSITTEFIVQKEQ
jgi:NitT/TauT family transport system substrate-binding protein